MTVAVRGRVPRWADDSRAEQSAQHIQERLQALERALAGGAPTFVAPSIPTFGSGPVPAGGSGAGHGAGGGGSVPPPTHTHPELVQNLQPTPPQPHVHRTADVVDYDEWQQVLKTRIFGG